MTVIFVQIVVSLVLVGVLARRKATESSGTVRFGTRVAPGVRARRANRSSILCQNCLTLPPETLGRHRHLHGR